jgi:diguanylate cyclase (GGDEF)-like protein/PAS domain S-box-containing protein
MALEHSEKRYRNFIETLPLSVVIVQNESFVYLNARAGELLGLPAYACLGRSFYEFVQTEDSKIATAAYQQGMFGEPGPACHDLRLVRQSGRVIDCHMYVRLVEWNEAPAMLGILNDVTEYKLMETELRNLATTDALTGLPNRRAFFARMDEALSRLRRGLDQTMMVLMVDLDHFKSINDRFGHASGDVVLKHFAAVLRGEVRGVDFCGRIGGEEFAVLLPSADCKDASVFAERLRSKVEMSSVMVADQLVSITVSIGVAIINVNDTTAEESLMRADCALYRAKAGGRNRVEIA